MIEEWRVVVGWPQYEASSEGRVRHARTKRVRTIYWGKAGYGYLVIGPKRQRQTCGVHQLVALAFHGPCPPGREVNHDDLDKSNNRPTNLEYLTRQENVDHAVAAGAYARRRKPVRQCA